MEAPCSTPAELDDSNPFADFDDQTRTCTRPQRPYRQRPAALSLLLWLALPLVCTTALAGYVVEDANASTLGALGVSLLLVAFTVLTFFKTRD